MPTGDLEISLATDLKLSFSPLKNAGFEIWMFWVFFRACYFQNEVGDPPFFYISDIANSESFNGKIFRKKINVRNISRERP